MTPLSFSFTSIYFLFFFLGTLLIYWFTPRRYRYISLLFISLLFIALISWASLFFLFFSITVMYFCARGISNNKEKEKEYLREKKGEMSLEEKKDYKKHEKRKRKSLLALGISLNLASLALMKYINFFIDTMNGMIHWGAVNTSIPRITQWFLPLGISFYTFQAIAYLVDVYWEKIKPEKNYLKFSLFLAYFPKILQGPIVRYEEMEQTLFEEKEFSYPQFTDGLKRMLFGYFKKMVVADTLYVFIQFAFAHVSDLSGSEALLAIVLYFLQDYCDFSGYMDIAIGLSDTLGIRLPENFRQPYLAENIDDYWRRWHITLGTWFKDYIFYPLSLSKFSLKLGKASKKWMPNFGKKVPAIYGLFIVWFLTGLWHGASWNYVLWGLYYGAIIILEILLEPLTEKFLSLTHQSKKSVPYRIYEHLVCILLLAIGKILFMCSSLKDAGIFLTKIFSGSNTYFDITNLNNQLGYLSVIFASVSYLPVLIIDILQEAKPNTTFLEKFDSLKLYFQWPLLILCGIAIVWWGFYGTGLPHFAFGYTQF